jgi:hypothetical protein
MKISDDFNWKEVGWVVGYVALIGLALWLLLTYVPR